MYKINHRRARDNQEEYFSNHRIVEVVRVTTEQQHVLDYMEQIIVMRENDKPDSFSAADFKYMNKNDIEDMSRIIWERVHDFQLGIESYQIKINLTAPILIFPGIEASNPYSIVDKPTTVLKEVKLKIFETGFLKKALLLGELDLERGVIMYQDMTYSVVVEMVMKKFKLDPNDRLNLSIKLPSVDSRLDITNDDDDTSEEDHFTRGPWLSAVEYLNVERVMAAGCLGDMKNYCKNGKLETVIGVIKSSMPNALGDLTVTLKGHRGQWLFTPKPSNHYLNITLRNMVKVYHKDTVF
ncbi:RNA-directed DNA polymerase, eukaryota, reverse transcriptase zinc-binding domain protein [Tanacetum coccineum]